MKAWRRKNSALAAARPVDLAVAARECAPGQREVETLFMAIGDMGADAILSVEERNGNSHGVIVSEESERRGWRVRSDKGGRWDESKE